MRHATVTVQEGTVVTQGSADNGFCMTKVAAVILKATVSSLMVHAP